MILPVSVVKIKFYYNWNNYNNLQRSRVRLRDHLRLAIPCCVLTMPLLLPSVARERILTVALEPMTITPWYAAVMVNLPYLAW